MNGIASVVRGDARHLPLPDASVDLIITSPPYYQLRNYTDGGEVYAGQIGAEPTFQEYIAALVECTAEWARVLKPSGSLFVNLADKYARTGGVDGKVRGVDPDDPSGRKAPRQVQRTPAGIREKSLMDLPARYRIACVDELGLINRATIIWNKTNAMPSSVKDRAGVVHEDWVHLTRGPRYFAAVDRIREESTPQRGLAGTFKRPKPSHTLVPGQGATQQRADRPDVPAYHPLGRLPGSVWDIATEPLIIPAEVAHRRCCGGVPREGCDDGLSHYAAFPTEWPRRLIQGWCPSGICTACGEPRRPVSQHERLFDGEPIGPGTGSVYGGDMKRKTRNKGVGNWRFTSSTTITGEVCACPEPTAPTRMAVVLDPCGGTGTAALVAKVLGRHGITVDMSADYCGLAQWRTTDPAQMAKAARVPAPPKEFDGQGDLLDGLGVVA